MAIRPRAPLPATALTLPSRYYTDPVLFEREQEVFYRRMWVNIARLEDIPNAGAWITGRVAGDSFMVVRTEDGGVRAHHNVCRHRGTQLCAGDRGEFGGRIQCPYHAWTYDYEGHLIGAPHMDGSPGFLRSDYPLHTIASDVWDGFVFVCIRPGGSLAGQLAGLPGKFGAWDMHALRRGHQLIYDVAANWKLIIQNYNECLHCPTLHPALNRLSHYLSGENEPFGGSYMGGRMDLTDGALTMSTDGGSPRAPLPGLSAEQCRHVYYYSVFPNFMFAPHPDYVLTHTLWPLAPDRTRIVCDWLVHPAEMAKSGFSLEDATTFWDLTNRQDWHVCELAQAGISSSAYRPGPYSNREELLHAFDRFVLEKLGE